MLIQRRIDSAYGLAALMSSLKFKTEGGWQGSPLLSEQVTKYTILSNVSFRVLHCYRKRDCSLDSVSVLNVEGQGLFMLSVRSL